MKPGGGGSLSVLRDKRVQVAAAAAALLGLVVFMRRGGGGGVSGDSIQPAGFDSSGSDLANAMQSAQDGWSNDLRAFSDQLRELNDLLGQRPPSGTGSTPPVPPRPIGFAVKPPTFRQPKPGSAVPPRMPSGPGRPPGYSAPGRPAPRPVPGFGVPAPVFRPRG